MHTRDVRVNGLRVDVCALCEYVPACICAGICMMRCVDVMMRGYARLYVWVLGFIFGRGV